MIKSLITIYESQCSNGCIHAWWVVLRKIKILLLRKSIKETIKKKKKNQHIIKKVNIIQNRKNSLKEKYYEKMKIKLKKKKPISKFYNFPP